MRIYVFGFYESFGWTYVLGLPPGALVPDISIFALTTWPPDPLHFDFGVKIHCRSWPWVICNGLGGLFVCLPPSSSSSSLVPGLWKGIPPTPLLSIACPSRLLRASGGWLVDVREAVGISFPPLVGQTLDPFSPGYCFFTLCFDSLRVLLALVVCLFVLLFSVVGFRLQDPVFFFFRSGVRVKKLAFLSTRCPASCLRSVLLVCLCLFRGVAACCCSVVCVFARVARLSFLFCRGCAWGVLVSFRVSGSSNACVSIGGSCRILLCMHSLLVSWSWSVLCLLF